MAGGTIETARLRLRLWRNEDLAPFAALNADPAVMEHFPKTLDRAESDAMVGRIDEHFAQHGFGFWAVEIKDGPFIGMVGLAVPLDRRVHALRRDRLAPGGGPLGPWLRQRSRRRGTRPRLRCPGPERDRRLDPAGQPPVARRHGTARHAPVGRR
jgi:hypothetical protein